MGIPPLAAPDAESFHGFPLQPLGRAAIYPQAKKSDSVTKAELEDKVFKWKGACLVCSPGGRAPWDHPEQQHAARKGKLL